MRDFIIGCDAGGTKTLTTLYDEKGGKLHTEKTGFGNLLVGVDKAVGHITGGVAACLAQCPPDASVYVYVGASGIHAGDNRDLLQAALDTAAPGIPVRILDDGLLALYALHKGRDGILVIAGTGSIAYAKRGATLRRVGGWGNVLGDLGSGYDIVRRALIHITCEHDDGLAYGTLSELLLAELGCDFYGMVKFAHTAEKGRLAALLPVVERAADAGDNTARALLAAAGADLADLVQRVYRRAGFAGRVPVAIKGGVLEKTPPVYEAFAQALDQRFAPVRASAPSELGAYYLYQEEKSPEVQPHG